MSVRRRDWRGHRSSAGAEGHDAPLLVRFLSASGVFHSVPGESARDRTRPSTWCFVSTGFRAIPPDSAKVRSFRPEKRGVRGSTPRSTTVQPLWNSTSFQGLMSFMGHLAPVFDRWHRRRPGAVTRRADIGSAGLPVPTTPRMVGSPAGRMHHHHDPHPSRIRA